MKVSGITIHNVHEAVAAAEQFLERRPDYDGSELSANVLFERHAKTGRPCTPDAFEYTFNELQREGLLEGYDPIGEMLEPVQDVRDYTPPPAVEQVEVPLTEDDGKYDEYEIELNEGVSPEDISVDDLLNGISADQLKAMIASAENRNAPQQKSVWDDVDSLSTAELAVLIGKLGKG